MKIGIDCRCLEGEKTGVGTYLSNLIPHILSLADKSICFVCYFEQRIPLFAWLDDARIKKRVITLPACNNFLWLTIRLPIELIKDRVNILHASSYTTPFIKMLKTIVTIHDISYAVNPAWYSYKSDFIRRYYYYKSAKSADTIITVSEFSKSEIVKYYRINPEKIKVIYHGTNKRFFQHTQDSVILEKYGVSGDYILYVGNLHTRRNIDRLIAAFVRLKSDHNQFHLLKMVFVGKDEGLLTSLLSLYVYRDDIIFTNYVPEEYMPLFYGGARCLIFPSLYEGFGFPVLEAMASGLPTIISDIPVFREVFKDNSLVVNPFNVDEIKNALFRLLTDEALWNSLSEKGKKHAASFTWEMAAKKTLEIYTGAIWGYKT